MLGQFRGVVVVLFAGVLTGVAQQQSSEKQQLSVHLDHFKNIRGVKLVAPSVVPPTDAECRASTSLPFPCYSPKKSEKLMV
jgi:hypothetical protein